MTTEIAAAGAWLGDARVPARHLLLLPESLPREGEVEIRVDAEARKLYLGRLAIASNLLLSFGLMLVATRPAYAIDNPTSLKIGDNLVPNEIV